MTLRLFTLFLRSRLAGWGGLGLVAIVGAFYWFGITQSATSTSDLLTGVKVAVPLLLALVIVTTTRSPFGEAERTASRSLPLLRGGQLIGMALVAIAGLALAADAWRGDDVRLLLIRNLAGLLGIGLLAALLLGTSLAWIVPSVAGFLALLTTPDELANISHDILWTWPTRGIDDRAALALVAVMTLVGLLAHARRGARDTLDEAH